MGVSDPQKLYEESETEYWKKFHDFLYIRKLDREFYLGIVTEALAKILGSDE